MILLVKLPELIRTSSEIINFSLTELIVECAMNNIYLSEVDPKNTSRSCSNKDCNYINENLQLSDREFECPKCKLRINR